VAAQHIIARHGFGEVVVEGTPFGRYLLIEQLGRGGMGEVWRAHDTSIDRLVAIKMLLPHFAQDAIFEQRFRREARAAARLDDPHAVPIHDVGEIDGRLYVTMRLIVGDDLQTLLENGPLEPDRAVRIIEQVAAALRAAHKVGLVHRDVKPSNVLVTEDDFAYLIDFGIARVAGETSLTATGATIGTWSYMAPERFTAGEIEPSSDTYALACVLYQCLAGELPFPGKTLEQVVVAHMMNPPPKLSEKRDDIPPAMDDVVATGMAKDPKQRYQSTTELAAAARTAITTPIPRAPAAPAAPAEMPPPALTDPPTQPRTLPAAFADMSMPPARPVTVPAQPAPPQVQPPAPANKASPAAPTRQAPPPAQPAARVVVPSSSPAPERRKVLLISAAVLAAAIVAVAIFLLIPDNASKSGGPGGPGGGPRTVSYGSQTEVPFTGLKTPNAVAVDNSGSVYVSDAGNNRALKWTGSALVVLHFTDLSSPQSVAVDGTGAVYVCELLSSRVLKLGALSSNQVVLTFGDVGLGGLAVDGSGTVYASGWLGNRVVKLAPGSSGQVELHFTGLNGPDGVAVDAGGAVYVSDSKNNRVLKLPADSGSQVELHFTGLNHPNSVAVDRSGTIYVVDSGNNRVLKLASGTSSQVELPFTGLNGPDGVAVDGSGNVYVSDSKNNRVLRLSAR
jgi:serine/threonine protein kinase, bacterial